MNRYLTGIGRGMVMILASWTWSENAVAQVEFGARVGANFAYRKVYNSLLMYSSPGQKVFIVSPKALRPALSVYARLPLAPLFHFESELSYMGMGYSDLAKNKAIAFKYASATESFSYTPCGSIYTNAGVYVGYLLKGEDSISGREKMDAGLTIGITFLLTDNLHGGIRYYNGLKDIGKVEKYSGSIYDFDVYNRALQIFFGFRLSNVSSGGNIKE